MNMEPFNRFNTLYKQVYSEQSLQFLIWTNFLKLLLDQVTIRMILTVYKREFIWLSRKYLNFLKAISAILVSLVAISSVYLILDLYDCYLFKYRLFLYVVCKSRANLAKI